MRTAHKLSVVDTHDMRLRQLPYPDGLPWPEPLRLLLEQKLLHDPRIMNVQFSDRGITIGVFDQNLWACNTLVLDFVRKCIDDTSYLFVASHENFDEISAV